MCSLVYVRISLLARYHLVVPDFIAPNTFDSCYVFLSMENLYIVIMFSIIVYMITKHFVHKLRKFPPRPFFSIPIIGHLYLLKKPMHRTLAKISSQYGPVVFLEFGSRPVLLVSSPSAAEDCFTTNDLVFANRPKLLAGKHLGYNYTTLTWAPYGDHWRNLRRIATIEILSNNRIQMFTDIRRDENLSLISNLKALSQKGQFVVVDMKLCFFKATLNTITRMITGRKEVPEARKFKEMVEENFRLSGATNIGDFMPILNLIGLNSIEKEMVKLNRKKDSSIQEMIELHRKLRTDSSLEVSKTIIDVLLSLQETAPEYYIDEIIRGLILVSFLKTCILDHLVLVKKSYFFWCTGHDISRNRHFSRNTRMGFIAST